MVFLRCVAVLPRRTVKESLASLAHSHPSVECQRAKVLVFDEQALAIFGTCSGPSCFVASFHGDSRRGTHGCAHSDAVALLQFRRCSRRCHSAADTRLLRFRRRSRRYFIQTVTAGAASFATGSRSGIAHFGRCSRRCLIRRCSRRRGNSNGGAHGAASVQLVQCSWFIRAHGVAAVQAVPTTLFHLISGSFECSVYGAASCQFGRCSRHCFSSNSAHDHAQLTALRHVIRWCSRRCLISNCGARGAASVLQFFRAILFEFRRCSRRCFSSGSAHSVASFQAVSTRCCFNSIVGVHGAASFKRWSRCCFHSVLSARLQLSSGGSHGGALFR
jgi:hypothetical protein